MKLKSVFIILALAIGGPFPAISLGKDNSYIFVPSFSIKDKDDLAKEGVAKACNSSNDPNDPSPTHKKGQLVGKLKCEKDGELNICAQPCKVPSKIYSLNEKLVNTKSQLEFLVTWVKNSDFLSAETKAYEQCGAGLSLSQPSCAPKDKNFYCTIVCAPK